MNVYLAATCLFYIRGCTYNISSAPCTCGKVYIGQKGRHISTILKEYKCHLRFNNSEKSAVIERKADTI